MSQLNDSDATLTFPLRLKLVGDDEIIHDWETLDYYWLDDAPKSNVPERHCFNCRYVSLRSPWFNDDDCLHPDSNKFFEMFLDAVENESMQHIAIAQHCPYYQPIYFKCSACHKRIETPMHLHTLFAPGLYDSEPCCSQDCHEVLVQKYEQELVAQEEYEQALKERNYVEETEDWEPDYHAMDFAFDAARERRYFGRK